jgi:hypothetical protein
MVNNQPITKLGPGTLVTVIVGDTCYRILHGEEELAINPAGTPHPSPASTSAAKAPSPTDVKDLARPVKHVLRPPIHVRVHPRTAG